MITDDNYLFLKAMADENNTTINVLLDEIIASKLNENDFILEMETVADSILKSLKELRK